jgi:hypothetical protein
MEPNMTRKDFFQTCAQRDLELASILASLNKISRAQIELWTLQHAANLRQQAQQQTRREAA